MKERIITLAVVASVSFGIAPALADDGQSMANNITAATIDNNLIADVGAMPRCYRRVYRRPCPKRVAEKPIEKYIKVEKEKIIEKPVVVQQVVEKEVVAPPTCIETNQPIVIDRFERRHRHLIHLGLFPIFR